MTLAEEKIAHPQQELGHQLEVKTIPDHTGRFDLRYATYLPPGQDVERFVVFVNGRTEWIEKYPKLHEWLQLPSKTGFLTWEHRGQGRSGGKRAYVEHYGAYAADAAKILHHVVGTRPYQICAHSMGSLISLYGTMIGALSPECLVLSSPLLRLPSKPLPHVLAMPASKLMSWAGLGVLSTGAGKHDRVPFEVNKLTNDRKAFERIQATPYPCPSATFEWVYRTYQAIAVCYDKANLRQFNTPTLVMTGSDERVVDRKGSQEWLERARNISTTSLEMLLVKGARHELFSEIPEHRHPAVEKTREWFRLHSAHRP